jgi:hypothetical protein
VYTVDCDDGEIVAQAQRLKQTQRKKIGMLFMVIDGTTF